MLLLFWVNVAYPLCMYIVQTWARSPVAWTSMALNITRPEIYQKTVATARCQCRLVRTPRAELRWRVYYELILVMMMITTMMTMTTFNEPCLPRLTTHRRPHHSYQHRALSPTTYADAGGRWRDGLHRAAVRHPPSASMNFELVISVCQFVQTTNVRVGSYVEV